MTDTNALPESKMWLNRIASALKREKKWRKRAKETVDLYEGEHQVVAQFNILYSNTETLSPALYNTTPRPVVQRRFKDDDPVGAEAAKVTQRVLEYLLDTGELDTCAFDDLIRTSVLEALVPGRGLVRFKYDPTITGEEGSERVDSEYVCGEPVPWDRFCHGYAKKWEQVPWIAIEHFMSKEEVAAAKFDVPVELTESSKQSDEGKTPDNGDANADDNGQDNEQLAHVYEIWDKVSRTVIFVSPNASDQILKRVPDPLKLTGFFPIPKPMTFFAKIKSLTPATLYSMYEEQAKELNAITLRIQRLIKMLKVRGFYDQSVESIGKVLEAEDGVMLPAENVAALYSQGLTIDKSIWLMPLDNIANVIQQLFVQRQQCKQVIYEITGVSDILRGASVASETATAQNIKNQWGTLRLKRMQKEVMRYVRDALRIMAEIAVTNMSQKSLAAMTGLKYPTSQQKAQAQLAVQQAQMTQQPPPPEAAAVLQVPSWEEIMQTLQSATQRQFKIDIETNSTVDTEATEDKQNISDLLNALAQFLAGVSPLVEAKVMPFEAAQAMLMSIVRRFRFGTDVEDALKAMKPPEPEQPDQSKVQAEQLKQQGEQSKQQHEAQMMQLEVQVKQQELAMRQKELEMEMQFKQQEHAMKMQELQQKGEQGLAQHQQRMAQVAQQKKQAAAPASA